MAVQKLKVLHNKDGQKIVLYQRDKKPYLMMIGVPHVLWFSLLERMQPDLPTNCRVRFYGVNDKLYDVSIAELLDKIREQ